MHKFMVTLLLLTSLSVSAQNVETKETTTKETKEKPKLEDKSTKTTHSVVIGGQRVSYTATRPGLSSGAGLRRLTSSQEISRVELRINSSERGNHE